jgi:tetratricopeptide (TPR) repeat protein
MLLMCCPLALEAGPGQVQIGGGPDRARLVFELTHPAIPALEQKDRTLIVNFPDTVGRPQRFTDMFIVRGFTFDGKKAVINLDRAYTCTGSSFKEPARYVLDIELVKDAAFICPIDHVETRISEDEISVEITTAAGHWPEVRCAGNRRAFLIFDGQADCSGLAEKFRRVPGIIFDGATRLEGSTALSFSLTEENAELEARTDEISSRIVLSISTPARLSRARVLEAAQAAFDQGDIAEAIRILEPYRGALEPQESIILARSYWKTGFPFQLDARAMEALGLMNQGIQDTAPGPKREAMMIEYSRMLLRSSLYAEALIYVRFLKESLSPEIAAEAYLQEMEIMNRKGEFQDAFVQNKRMLAALGDEGMPRSLESRHLAALADTYLGLSAYPRAWKLYQEALALDRGVFHDDPDLYARMAEAAYRLNHFSDARDCILSAVNLGRRENRAEHLLFLGECLYRLDERSRAMTVFSEVENIAPQSESETIAKLKTARIIIEQELAEKGTLSDKGYYAVMDIYENLKSTPEYLEGPLGLIIKIRIAQVYALRGDWDSALEAYHLAWADTRQDDPVNSYALAEAQKCLSLLLKSLHTNGSYDMVAEYYHEYRDSLMANIDDPEILFILGRSLHEMGDSYGARHMLVSCIERPSPREREALLSLFDLDYNHGLYTEALVWNTRYLESFPGGPEAALMEQARGRMLYFLGRFTEAVPYLEKTASGGNSQASLEALSMLADAHARLGDSSREAETLERIIALSESVQSPLIEKAIYVRASRFKEQDELLRARKLFEMLLKKYPDSAYRDWAAFHLAEILHGQGEHGAASKHLEAVIGRSTDMVLHELALGYLGQIELGTELGEFRKLKDRFKRK